MVPTLKIAYPWEHDLLLDDHFRLEFNGRSVCYVEHTFKDEYSTWMADITCDWGVSPTPEEGIVAVDNWLKEDGWYLL